MVTPEQIDIMKLMGVEVAHCLDTHRYEAWLDGDLIAESPWSASWAWEIAWQRLNKSIS